MIKKTESTQINYGIFFLLTIAVFIFASIIATLFATIFSIAFESMAFIFLSSATTSISLILFCVIFSWLNKLNLLQKVKFTIPKKLNLLLILPIFLLMFFCFSYGQILFAALLDATGYISTNPLSDLTINGGLEFAASLLIMGLLTAIAEELVFRGMLLLSIRSAANDNYAILISSLCFMLMHMSPDQTIFQFLLALTCGYVTIKSESILPAIIIHFLNNAFSVCLTYLNVTTLFWIPENIGLLIVLGTVFIPVGIVALSLIIDSCNNSIKSNFVYRIFCKDASTLMQESPLKNSPKETSTLKSKTELSTTNSARVFLLLSCLFLLIMWVLNLISGYSL